MKLYLIRYGITQEYAEPKGKYYEWLIPNGEFFELNIKFEKFI
ncbi:hypothetical protein C809_01225 [Lachnospiraceae bacterium MD335]|nr:hypothetical protein C809_01225 [Lachnospiraceae bacterium MD335]